LLCVHFLLGRSQSLHQPGRSRLAIQRILFCLSRQALVPHVISQTDPVDVSLEACPIALAFSFSSCAQLVREVLACGYQRISVEPSINGVPKALHPHLFTSNAGALVRLASLLSKRLFLASLLEHTFNCAKQPGT